MRNLKILNQFDADLFGQDGEGDACEVVQVCFDEFGKVFFVYTKDQTLHVFQQESAETNPAGLTKVKDVCFADENPTLGEATLVGFEYLQELSGVVLAFSTGSMYLFRMAPEGDQEVIEEVGELPGGILAAKWAPNQEFYAVAGKEGGKLLLFTPDFDVLYEDSIDDGDMTYAAGEEKNLEIGDATISWRGDSSIFVINFKVGSGRKCLTRNIEKQMAVAKGPARADDISVFSVSEKPIPTLESPICMMPNGSLVAGFQNRSLPGGQFSPDVIFWEKNGLRRGNFTLPGIGATAAGLPRTQLHSMSFNVESNILAIHCAIDAVELVLVYTRNNWQWYCKQQINMRHPLKSMLWFKKQQLCVVDQTGHISFSEYHFAYCTSLTNCNHKGHKNQAYVAFVDNYNVNLSPLSNQVIPPPLYLKQIQLPAFPNCLSLFGNTGIAFAAATRQFYAFDCGAEVKPSDFPYKKELVAPGVISFDSTLADGETITDILNYVPGMQGAMTIACTVRRQGEEGDILRLYKAGGDSVSVVGEQKLNGKIQTVCLGSKLHHSGYDNKDFDGENGFYIEKAGSNKMEMFGFDNIDGPGEDSNSAPCLIAQTTDKIVHKVTFDEDNQDEILFSAPYLFVQMQTCLISGKEVTVGLTQNLRLFLNDKLFSNECTSFLLNQNFLAFVNSSSGLSHELFIYDLNRPLPQPTTFDNLAPPKHASLEDHDSFNVRAVERGSRLVLIYGFKCLLQLPRGNLEGIQPRIILLKAVVQMIQQKQYGRAFRLLRQHKLDINLMYDVDPEQFIDNIDLFVSEVKQVDYLNLFINSLTNQERGKELEFMMPQKEEDLLQKAHNDFMSDFTVSDLKVKAATQSKVNRICEALKESLNKINAQNEYLLPILTTFIKKEPQELKQALSKIQEMQRHEEAHNLMAKVVPPHLNPATMKKDIDPNAIKLGSKEALEYVSWLVQPNRLFDVAMTTYDFDLVTLVASQTQKDPKEYVPYIESLKAEESVDYMKFRVHNDLKDYDKALKKLLKSPNPEHFEEAVTLTRKQRLFREAMNTLEAMPENELHAARLKQIKLAFGTYLDQRGYRDEAGLMFMASGDLEQAQVSFGKAGNVTMSLAVVAQRTDLSAEQREQVKEDLIERLINSLRYEEAGDMIDHTSDFNGALDCYLKGNSFAKAIKLCQQQAKPELVNSQIKPVVLISCDLIRTKLIGILEAFGKRVLRLKIVQHTKRSMPDERQAGNDNFELDSDNLSVSNASQSQFSSRNSSSRRSGSQSGFSETSKMSKRNNTKKKMKKKRAVKEGSPFEEEYILDSVKEETKCNPDDKTSVKDLMQVLVLFGMVAEACQLHSYIEKVIKASHQADLLTSVEQQAAIAKDPETFELFDKELGKTGKDEKLKKELTEWENAKCFKH